MKIENIDINKTIENAKNQIAADKSLTPALRSTFELLILGFNLHYLLNYKDIINGHY